MRPPGGTYDQNGRWQSYDRYQFQVQAVVEPFRPDPSFTLMHPEEGRRIKGAIKIFCTEELKSADVDEQSQPDIVLWKNNEYQVEEVTDWSDYGGYYQVMAVKMGQ
jgi:hypothetical protein